MSNRAGTAELPKSLQAMIAESAEAVERSKREGSGQDDTDEYFVRLGRGEYEEDLYWECVAQDCEEAGDWDGAKTAYTKLIHETGDGKIAWWSVHHGIAMIHGLLGENRKALAHYHTASIKSRSECGGIFYRICLDYEAGQLLKMGRVRAARRAVLRGLASFEEGSDDALGYARLIIAQAACEIASQNTSAAEANLMEARAYLEALQAQIESVCGDSASGVDSVFARWWRVEAHRRRLAGEGESEIEARQNAVALSRRAAEGWQRVGWEVAAARDLGLLADVLQRHGRGEEEAVARAGAEEIRRRWHLPEEAAAIPSNGGPIRRFLAALLRKWN